jgi:ABC-type methionine transport system ATPase subunit
MAMLNRAQHLTVIVVTHEVSLVREFSHTLIQLKDGRVLTMEAMR